MTGSELIVLSLGLSIGVAAAGGLAASVLDRLSGDTGLRERAWTAALWLPTMPPMAVAALLLTPAPMRTVTGAPIAVVETLAPETVSVTLPAAVGVGLTLDGGMAAAAILALATSMIGVRLVTLGRRAQRLNRLIARTIPTSPETEASVAAAARSLGAAVPAVRACTTGSDALLTGMVRPLLILPLALAQHPEAPVARAVITHELAHLKRGDHRAMWLEEGLLTLLAFNPLLPSIRARRAAAREEACDALALVGAGSDARRAYAQSLIEALRARTDTLPMPALTFTGVHRSQAMRRLKSILTPPATAGRGTRIAAVFAGVGLLGLAGTGSLAIAAQRPVQIGVVPPTEAVRFTVDLTYDPAIRIAKGDRLVVDLSRELGKGSMASSGMALDIAPGALPDQTFADLRPPLLPDNLRTGSMFAMTAQIIDAKGVVKATSDRDQGQPFAPYLVGPRAISTRLRMLPVGVQPVVVRPARPLAAAAAVVKARPAAPTALVATEGQGGKIQHVERLEPATSPIQVEPLTHPAALARPVTPDDAAERDVRVAAAAPEHTAADIAAEEAAARAARAAARAAWLAAGSAAPIGSLQPRLSAPRFDRSGPGRDLSRGVPGRPSAGP